MAVWSNYSNAAPSSTKAVGLLSVPAIVDAGTLSVEPTCQFGAVVAAFVVVVGLMIAVAAAMRVSVSLPPQFGQRRWRKLGSFPFPFAEVR